VTIEKFNNNKTTKITMTK